MATTQIQIPSIIYAGDTISWTVSSSDYPAPTYTCVYTLIASTGKYTVTSAASGSSHLLTITAAVSAQYAAGVYEWRQSYSDGTNRYTVASGTIEIKADPASATDTRTTARKMVTALETALLTSPGPTVEIDVDGTRVKYDTDKAMKMLAMWKNILYRETHAGAAGPRIAMTYRDTKYGSL